MTFEALEDETTSAAGKRDAKSCTAVHYMVRGRHWPKKINCNFLSTSGWYTVWLYCLGGLFVSK